MANPLLRHYRRLFLLLILVLVGVGLAEWITTAIEDRRTPQPVKVARSFLEALRDGRIDDDACKRALSLLSEASRNLFEAQAQEARARDARYGAKPRACTTSLPAAEAFGGISPDSARLVSEAKGRAVVGFERYDADEKSFLIPGFWPTRWIVTKAEIELVEEAGTWKVFTP